MRVKKVKVRYGAGNSMYVERRGTDGKRVKPLTRIGFGVLGFGSYVSRSIRGNSGYDFFPIKILKRGKK